MKQALRKVARDIGIGRLLMKYIHAPRHRRNEIAIVGQERFDNIQRCCTRLRATTPGMTPFPPQDPQAPELTWLTGKKFWPETILCAATLLRTSDIPLRLHFVDDGTLDREAIAAIERVLPGTRFTLKPEIEARMNRVLPKKRFRKLRFTRTFYPHIKKLIDVHAGTTEDWKVVLDSDMLFWHRPGRFLDWVQDPRKPLLLVDVKTAYGYPDALLEELAGGPLPPKVNVGITGLHTGELDWEQLEYWIATMLDRVGRNYYMEQAIIAGLVREREVEYLDEVEYRCYPSAEEMETQPNILQHYVAETKYIYYERLWEHAMNHFALSPQQVSAK